MLSIFTLGLNKKRSLRRVMAAGLLYIDMFACVKSRNGHWGMPMIRRRYCDSVDVSGRENFAEVLVGGGGVTKRLFCLAAESLQYVAFHVADMSDLCIFLVRLQRTEMSSGSPVKSDHGEINPFV